jgi:hypothetical protein
MDNTLLGDFWGHIDGWWGFKPNGDSFLIFPVVTKGEIHDLDFEVIGDDEGRRFEIDVNDGCLGHDLKCFDQLIGDVDVCLRVGLLYYRELLEMTSESGEPSQ